MKNGLVDSKKAFLKAVESHKKTQKKGWIFKIGKMRKNIWFKVGKMQKNDII